MNTSPQVNFTTDAKLENLLVALESVIQQLDREGKIEARREATLAHDCLKNARYLAGKGR